VLRARPVRGWVFNYSGGYDWTFVSGPISKPADYLSARPQSEAYGKYADAHMRELIERYKPAVLWNDISYPKSGHPLEIMAEYHPRWRD
jgi:alpha-L-fucosidase